MLLERGNVNPNQGDTECGRTPLLGAAGDAHERVVKIFFRRESCLHRYDRQREPNSTVVSSF